MARTKKEPVSKPRGHTITDKEIGLRIRAMRTDLSISQDELGKLLNVSFQQIQKYEKGVNRIAAARIIQIANALETTPHHLLGWNGEAKLTATEFDLESYKLARIFVQLPDRTKPAIRSLINSLISSG